MNIGEKCFALVIEIVQQPGQMVVTGIEHNMAVTQSFAPQAQQQRQGYFTFGPECQRFGNAGRLAALWVSKLMLGHKQPAIHQGESAISHQRSKRRSGSSPSCPDDHSIATRSRRTCRFSSQSRIHRISVQHHGQKNGSRGNTAPLGCRFSSEGRGCALLEWSG